ncbi:MAG: hypothetical protein JST39_11275 [Bacteroidetes bacterium]|nr:hypothetical protein [Bacteroidota bacterium]
MYRTASVGKYIVLPVVFLVLLTAPVLAQQAANNGIQLKNVPDTILGRRTLLLPLEFDAKKALLALFPGRWYDLGDKAYRGQLVSWKCRTCKIKTYHDVNEVEGDVSFPYSEGVATRVINVLDFADSSGHQYKLMSFNHSAYDSEGLQAGRFTGGLLGMAKFNRTDSGWRLQAFQPAIAAYGAFQQAPEPRLLKIGEDQYALLIEHVNGGAGGPYPHDYYLIAGMGGAYTEVLAAYNVGRSDTEDTQCAWTATCKTVPAGPRYFRDIIVTSKGSYHAADTEGLPAYLKDRIKGSIHGQFTITRTFFYTAGKGYNLRMPPTVTIIPAK